MTCIRLQPWYKEYHGSNTLEAITAVKEENKSDKEDEDDVAAFKN
jgi:hypothetical protein